MPDSTTATVEPTVGSPLCDCGELGVAYSREYISYSGFTTIIICRVAKITVRGTSFGV